MLLSDSESSIKNPATKKSASVLQPDRGGGEDQTTAPVKTMPDLSTPPPVEPAKRGFIPVLKNRNFLTLWSGQVFSQLADKVYLVLMISLITTHFKHPGESINSSWVSGLMIAFTIPAVLFGSLAGVFVDRWPKKLVLVGTNILRGIMVLTIPIVLWFVADWTPIYNLPVGLCMLLVITFGVSTLTQFFAPAEQAVIPLIVKREDLLSANSLYTTTMMASLIVGFALGEPLLALADTLVTKLNYHWDFGKELVVGGSYAIAGLLLLFLKTGEKTEVTTGETPHVFADIRDGLRYVKHQRRVRNAMIQLVILFSIFAALAVLAVRLADILPGLKPSQFGLLLAMGGIGMAGGAAILGHWGHQFTHNRLSLYGSVGMACALIGLSGFSHNLWLSFLMMILLGGFGALVGIPMQTTIQAETPEEMRGKVFGLQNNGINIALSLPLALAGVAETWLGFETVFLSLAGIAIAGGILNWYISGKCSVIQTKPNN
ncbi:MAG TPA: arabinose efflux permease [Cyanobacteria bacterium UBA11149]|nr:arabinose efflux permease [Cyanobacteria bacterium UBA11367]HBE60900.1 arabinose efflux permease [Cyanobacteria bacterium UBA11366]HBK63415.1 arabinose efflux permease [Cyanobacteria bacterium UBA11166]HBR76602.1 arabinose efflux permease [Cyanobacteria bacterium UBA11159]HBS68493.1 arabinose efflux permease [Cyanobacteria bacterium UBA11153]HBW91255.1 arabinose efflux permease [Cyanobacteria bacterium UBA11149]HCA97421.1 arabinose efflux permease [Cyanobacteria bacterium UBA9226]